MRTDFELKDRLSLSRELTPTLKQRKFEKKEKKFMTKSYWIKTNVDKISDKDDMSISVAPF